MSVFRVGQEPQKPDGEAIEIVDFIIRGLDMIAAGMVGAKGVCASELLTTSLEFATTKPLDEITFEDLAPACRGQRTFKKGEELQNHYDLVWRLTRFGAVDGLTAALGYMYLRSWPISELLTLKHEFNKTRPYRHGGKLA